MDRLARTLILTLLITVAYHAIAVIATQLHAPVLQAVVRLVDHGHGFTLGIAAACVATAELPVLACVVLGVLLVTWPTDLVHLSVALVSGGLLGTFLRSFIRAHRHERESLPPKPDVR